MRVASGATGAAMVAPLFCFKKKGGRKGKEKEKEKRGGKGKKKKMLGEHILSHSDNLSTTLQAKEMSASEGQRVAGMTLTTLNGLRNNFQSFWVDVTSDAKKLNIGEPQKPRPKNPPIRLSASPGFHPRQPQRNIIESFIYKV